MKITLEQLKRKKACTQQVKLFKATFGFEAEVTLENCLKAAKEGLDFDWAARKLLSAPAWAAYDAAMAYAVYEAAIAPTTAPAWAAYKAAAAAQAFFNACKIEETEK